MQVSKDNDNHHAPPRQIVFDEELQELILLSVLCEGDVQGSQNSHGNATSGQNANRVIFTPFERAYADESKCVQKNVIFATEKKLQPCKE